RASPAAESPCRSRCSGCGRCPSRSSRSWRPPARLAGRLSAAPGQTPAVRLPSPLPRRLLSGHCVGLNRSSPSSRSGVARMRSAPAPHHRTDSFGDQRSATGTKQSGDPSVANTLAGGRSLMQSAKLHSHPLRVLDVEARLGAPPVLQTAALQLLLQPILLRVPVRNGVGDVVHFGRAAASPVPGNQHVIAEHQAALLSVVFSDLHAQEIHIEVADLLIIVHLIRDVVDVEGLERLARGPSCRRYPGRRGCREAQALNELPPVHFSLFEILEQFCDDTFHCLSSYSQLRRDSIGLPALCHYTICEGSVGSEHRLMSAPGHQRSRCSRPRDHSCPLNPRKMGNRPASLWIAEN